MNIHKMKNKGFTLIELLVVIAIIGILSAVVLASLNTARDKAADANIKSNLANVRAQAEIIYDGVSPNSYATVCDNANVSAAKAAAENAAGGTGVCNDDDANEGNEWVLGVPLKTSSTLWWCVDYKGASTSTSKTLSGLSNGDVDCD
jgi:prepilin-type N-terminal cleavage/methylation domain-containing protein